MVTFFASTVLATVAAFSLTNDNVAISFDASGGVSSLMELPGGHEANRRSYLQPQLKYAALDRWIRYAQRGGFETIHLRRWMETLGHYAPKRDHFPNGMADFLDAAKRIRAAGLAAGVHTLTGCISPKDPWIASDMNRDLLAWCTYRLAAPLSADATELEVTEAPKFLHDTILSYFGNGNALRIGTEIVQYSGFTKTPPFRYTGLVRGAFGTKAAAHGADEPVDYLQQRYMAFYPRPGSALCDALTKEVAGFVNGGGFGQIYMDGSGGMGLKDRDCTAEMRRRIFAAVGRGITVEASCDGPHNWWYQSRDGAWDGASFDYKPYYDLHLKTMDASRKANLLEPQLGWWHFREQWLQNRGQFADAAVGVNGTRETVPFKVVSGEYATREADGWRHWDIKGELKGFVPAAPLSLRPGENEFDFAVTPTGDGSARARICTFAIGKGVKALRDGLTAATSSKLAYEAGLSGKYAPESGCTELPPVKMRPGETAEVTFEFVGPLKGGRLAFDGKFYPVRGISRRARSSRWRPKAVMRASCPSVSPPAAQSAAWVMSNGTGETRRKE